MFADDDQLAKQILDYLKLSPERRAVLETTATAPTLGKDEDLP